MLKRSAFLLLTIIGFTVQAQNVDVFGPQPFREILDNEFPINSWTPSAPSAVKNLQYFLLLDAETKSNVVTLSDDNSTLAISSVGDVIHTYGTVLRSVLQIVDINSDTEDDFANKYRMVPLLHSYFALNYSSGSSEVFAVDVGSYYVEEATGSGYLVVEFDGTPDAVILSASGQYTYNSTTGLQEENSSWTRQWFVLDNGKLSLTGDEADATTFFMADARDLIDNIIDDGSDFNPTGIDWQTNPFAAYPEGLWKYEESDFNGSFLMDVDEAYMPQFGDHESTLDAAVEALNEIESTLTTNGESLRYDKEVYLTFRENLLSRTLSSTDIYNGRLNERLVAYVYFTNAADDSGAHHPFMVIASHNISDSPNYLIDVSRPPGDGSGGGYAEQSITRNAVLGYFLIKIPLKDYGVIDQLTDNDLSPYGILADELDTDPSDYDVYNYVGPSSQAIAIDGVVVYPGYNNNLRFAAEDGEITSTGIHVGRGMGLHYHADGHGFNQNGLNLYNLADYEGKNHPPMIGFGYDGLVMFGRYEEGYASMAGFGEALDDYGGHDHDGFGYHYHAFSKSFEAQGPVGGEPIPFTQHFFNVGAWRGNINGIPGFLEVTPQQLKNEDIGRYAGASYESGEPGPGSVEVEACESYVWEGTTYTTSGTYTVTLTNASGGDSLVTLELTIWEEPVALVTASDGVLMAEEQEGVTYQWYDCEKDTSIENQTNSSFTPMGPGSFAVSVSNGACSVLSACVEVDETILSTEPANGILVYPNPVTTDFRILGISEPTRVTVMSISGQIISQITDINSDTDIPVPKPPGVYLIKIDLGDKVLLKRIITTF